jgi:methyl-accepting chemotaxis protein
VIQQNATGSEEMAATSEELAGQAEQMLVSIGSFRLTESNASLGRLDLATRHSPRAKAPVMAKAANHLPAPRKEHGEGLSLAFGNEDSIDHEFERY